MKIDEVWLRSLLPEEYANEPIGDFSEYDLDGFRVLLNERGVRQTIYSASDEEDLRRWVFREVCLNLAWRAELQNRKTNARKWRYSREHCENGQWFYVERTSYIYDAIEDFRLAAFEDYLKLIRRGVPEAVWRNEVEKHISLLNLRYRESHWDYDLERLCFVEISDSKEYDRRNSSSEEPRPGSIIARERNAANEERR